MGYLLENSRTRSVYAELRQGCSYNWNDRAMITPHLTQLGCAQQPDPQGFSYAQLGGGVSWKWPFNETVHSALRSSFELTLKDRQPLDKGRSSGWVMIGVLRY